MTRTVTLGELFKVGSSKRVLKSQWKTEGVPFYRGREITRLSTDGFVDNELFISEDDYAEYSAKYGVPSPGDIVITAIGTIGNTYIVRADDRFYFKDASVLWLKKIADISSEFINFWLKSPLFFDQLDKGNGATVDTLTIKKMQNVQIDLPPLPEQKRIVAILDEAFAGIDAAVANTEKNLANARDLFESYLNAVFTQKGEGWVEKTLVKLTDKIGSGATPRGGQKAYKQKGISLIRSLNVYDRHFNENKLAFIDDEQAEKLSNVVVEKGDVLFNITGASIARCCVAPSKYLPARVNQHVSILRPRKKELSTELLCYLMTSRPYKDHLLGIGDEGGSTRQAITKAQLQNLVVAFPASLNEQADVVAQLDALADESKRLEVVYQQKLEALVELKQSILQKAFAGELTALPEKEIDEAASNAHPVAEHYENHSVGSAHPS
jgi:type I restriction enzyme S subunit